MPQMDIRRKYTYGRKKKKKQNLAVALVSGLFPWRGDTPSDVVRKIVFLVAISALTASSVLILNFYFGAHGVEDNTGYYEFDPENDNKVVWVPTVHPSQNGGNNSNSNNEPPSVEILEKYQRFLEINPEFVGYLSIDPYINYPVAQAQGDKSQDYYLHHNFEGRPTENGTIFACKYGEFTPTERPHNVIIHGHNLTTKNMFTPLNRYLEFDFLKENPIINFDTLYEPGKYKVISVFQTNVDDTLGDYYDYWRKRYFHSKDDFYEYVSEVLDRSRFHTGVDLRYGDELLTLSTCDFNLLDNLRLVVVARRVRYDERAEVDTSQFVNLRETTAGRNSDGLLRYKMFDGFYTHVNRGKGWAGREWDVSRVEGIDEWLKKKENERS
ncbi:MAG: class B sortase [Oscillospiraceae bacterium]|nr:class B sortase [Oscillospiraceae bacterium]